MLSNILAVLVGVGSFLLYMAAFFFPEVHRKGDFFWSGIGMFYALVLWFCAGRMTGAVLLGQTATVAFMGWFAWQTLLLRRQVTPAALRTEVSDTVVAKSGGFGLFKAKPKDKPVAVAASGAPVVAVETSAPQKVVTKSGGFGLFKGKAKDKPASVATSSAPGVESLPSLEDVLVPQKPEAVSPATVIQVEEMPVSVEASQPSVEEILANIEQAQAPVEEVPVVATGETPVSTGKMPVPLAGETPVSTGKMPVPLAGETPVSTGKTPVPLVEDDDFGLDDVEVTPAPVRKVEEKKEPVVGKKKEKNEKKEKKEKPAKAAGPGLGAIFAPLTGLFAKKKDKKAVEAKPAPVVKAEETPAPVVKVEETPVAVVKVEEMPVVAEMMPEVDAVFEDVTPVVEDVTPEVTVEETVVLTDTSVTVMESVTVEFEPVVEPASEETVPELVRPNEPSAELVEAAQPVSEEVPLADVAVEEIAPEVDLAPPAEASVEAAVEVSVEVEAEPAVALPVEPLAEGEPVVSQESEGGFAELVSSKREDVARVEVAKRSAQASSAKGGAGDVKDDNDDF